MKGKGKITFLFEKEIDSSLEDCVEKLSVKMKIKVHEATKATDKGKPTCLINFVFVEGDRDFFKEIQENMCNIFM